MKLGWSFSGPGDDGVGGDADLAEQAGHFAGFQQHADGAGQRGLAREDAFGGDGDHVARRCRRAAHHSHHRLLCGNAGDRVVQALAACHAAARAVDRDDQGFDAGVVRQLVDRVVELAVVADDPADGQPFDMRATDGDMRTAQRNQNSGEDSDDREAAPYEQAPLEATPVE